MSRTDEYATLIQQHIPDARVTVSGDGGRFEATVISDRFEGQNLLNKHRLVYAALDDQIRSGEIHALSIRAYTPDEWQQTGGEA